MPCVDELTLSIHADGELGAAEAARIELHLADCASCRSRYEELRGESLLLASVIEEDWDPVPSFETAPLPGRGRSIPWIGGATLAALAAARLGAGWLQGALPAGAVGWLNPVSEAGRSNLMFQAIFNLAEGGWQTVLATLPVVAVTLAALLASASAAWVLTRPSAPFASRPAH